MSKGVTAPSDFGGSLHSDGAYAQAQLDDLIVVLPSPSQLFVDIDNDDAEHLFHKNLTKVSEYVGVYGWVITQSRSGEPERKHITVDLSRDVTPMERILLQAVLGSDLRRELLSYCRITINDPRPTLFLEKKVAGFLPIRTEPLLLKEADSTPCGFPDDGMGYYG